MKQHSIFSSALAPIDTLAFILSISLLAVSCQKEEVGMGTVTLGAKMQETVGEGGKAYIDGYTPCWHNGDRVYINDAAYSVVAASGASAQIENVTASSSYRAIFPASIVTPGTDISANSRFLVTLPAVQHYESVGGHQRVDVPMGAFLTGESTLQFHNLCSIVRVTVSNALNQELPLRLIELKTDAAMLSGPGLSMVNGQETDYIRMLRWDANHSVCLSFTDDNPIIVPALGSKKFDIVVPAFETDNVTFTLYTTDGYYSEMTKTNKALAHNTITTITMNITSLTQIAAAELVDGPTFNTAIPNNATAVVFEYNNPSVTSGTLLSTTDSPTPIYGNIDSDGTTWRVSTAAIMMNANQDCSNMFYYRMHLTSIDFGEGFNTSNVTNMSSLFGGCSSLTNLDVSHFNTSSVTNMSGMFSNCRGLTSLDVSHFNTSSVTNMSGMFSSCLGLTSLDVSHFNTSSVTNMSGMFSSCLGLTSLDVSNFNTSSVTSMSYMFSRCSILSSLDLSNFNTSNVTNMGEMFAYCSNLTGLDLSSFNTSNVTNMFSFFAHCRSLRHLDVSFFNTENVRGMSSMFEGCQNLTSIDVSYFNTENVSSMTSMFKGCQTLTSLDLSNFNTSNVISMDSMFSSCTELTIINLFNFDMSHLGTWGSGKEGMFYDCSSSSGHCTITCPLAVENAIKELNPDYDPNDVDNYPYYYTGLPTSGVTFTWVRPSTSK